jgi:hypothetical protein
MKKLAIIYTGQPRLLPELLPYHEFLAKVLKKEMHLVGIDDIDIDLHYCLWDYNTVPSQASKTYYEKNFINRNETANQILSYYKESEIVCNSTVQFYSYDLLESITDEFYELCKQNDIKVHHDTLLREFASGVSQLLIRKIAVDNMTDNYDAVLFSRTDSIIKLRGNAVDSMAFRKISRNIISVLNHRNKPIEQIKIFNKNVKVFEDYVFVSEFYASIMSRGMTHDHQIISSTRGFKEMFSDFKSKLFNYLLKEIKVFYELYTRYGEGASYNVILSQVFNPHRLFVLWFFDRVENIDIKDGMTLLTLKTSNELRQEFRLIRNRDELESNPIPKEY